MISRLPKVYCGYLKDEQKLLKSASGGAATALTEAFLNQGGCVFGVAWSEDYKSAGYICCESEADLERIKGSKYCETRKDLPLLAEKLKAGRLVLFIGLGCDVAAAKAYCKTKGIPTESLFTVDILCHGPVPSLVHEKYIEGLENEYNSSVVSFSSRSKRDGWSSSSLMKAVFKNGKVMEKLFDETDYGFIFNNYALPRCLNCRFKGENHQADMCIGDYWGIDSNSELWNRNGVSILIEQTDRAKDMIHMLGKNFMIEETDARFALDNNPYYSSSRTALFETTALLDKLKGTTLHTALKQQPAYKQWKRKNTELRMKRTVLRFLQG